MPDKHSTETRSYNMSQIKLKNTKPEMLVRKYLFSHGFRYRLHDKRYPGHPDIVLSKYKVAIFINGCFWHVHEGCKYFVWPQNNKDFWQEKLSGNVVRDKKNLQLVRDMGWKPIVVWECELKKGVCDSRLERLRVEIIANE
ncbi:MAG: very short patch repair endonuclease [Negativicutes bacterium]